MNYKGRTALPDPNNWQQFVQIGQGRSICLLLTKKLRTKPGTQPPASPAERVVGVILTDVKLEKRQKDTVAYYMLEKFKIADTQPQAA